MRNERLFGSEWCVGGVVNGPFELDGSGAWTIPSLRNALIHFEGLEDGTARMINFSFSKDERRPTAVVSGTMHVSGEIIGRFAWFAEMGYPIFQFNRIIESKYKGMRTRKEGNVLIPMFRPVLGPHDNPSLIISGDLATPDVHAYIRRTLTNLMDDPFYLLHINAGAYFQGGSYDRNGKWFYVEMSCPFWVDEYVEAFNNNLTYHLDGNGKIIIEDEL